MIPPVVIIAGGIANRLRPLTESIPKAMLMVAGEPFIAQQLSLLKKNGIRQVVICSGYLSQQIEDFVGDGSRFGLSVVFSADGEKLLGTGGAVKKALSLLDDIFFVMYGDSYLTVNFKDVYNFFITQQTMGLMTVFKNRDAWDTSNIVFKDGKIVIYDKKNKTKEMQYIDYGLGILKKTAFDLMPNTDVFDLSGLYQELILKKQMAGYEVPERFYEIGSLKGLKETQDYILKKQK
jgi:NDP-sugar pyrophosphorylase family protein